MTFTAPIPWEDGKETNIKCPECGDVLTEFSIERGKDDYIIELLCSECGYHELI